MLSAPKAAAGDKIVYEEVKLQDVWRKAWF
jgi:hypothetical protein